MADLPADPTLDEIRAALAPILPDHAAFDGWRKDAVESAALQIGIDTDIAQLAFDSAMTMIDAWFASIDARMAEAYTAQALADMKIRSRITALIEARLALLAPHREALRRALAILAMPTNIAMASRLGWRAADAMWRLAGDTAVDYNHYTKRATLAGIYAATLLVFLDDETETLTETRAFLSRRIDGLMRFEKAKAGFKARSEHRISLSRFVGRLRYPAI